MARTKTRDASPVLQQYVFLNLSITSTALVEAEDNRDTSDKYRGHPRLRPVLEHDIEETRQRFSWCKCEQRGLYAGMTVDSLIHLGAGCTDPHYVCPRLDALRRMYEY